MKRLLITLILIYLSVCSSQFHAQDSKTFRVLFLGNSEYFSRGGLFPSFEGFCQAANLNYEAVSQWGPVTNPMGIDFLNFGRIPVNLPDIAANEEIHNLIRSGNFNYVVISAKRIGYLLPEWVQLPVPGKRGQPVPYEKNLEALAMIHRTIVASGAKMIFYMEPGPHAALESWIPVAQIYQKLHTDLENMDINGKKHEVILVPALLFWIDGLRRYGKEGWFVDAVHGTALARFSSACLLYTYITGKDPRGNGFNKLTELTRNWEPIPGKANLTVSAENAKWIKEQVWLYYSTRPR